MSVTIALYLPVPTSYSDELPALEAVWAAIWAATESQGKGLGHFYVSESEFLPRRQKEKRQVPDYIEQQNGQWILKGKGQDEAGDRIILVKEDVCSVLREEWDKVQRSGEKQFFNKFKARYIGLTRDDWQPHLRRLMPAVNLAAHKASLSRPPTTILSFPTASQLPTIQRWPSGLYPSDVYQQFYSGDMDCNLPDSSIFQSVVQLLVESPSTIALIGAGVSCAAGVPCFRGNGGVYKSSEAKNAFTFDTLRSRKGADIYYKAMGEFATKARGANPTPFHTMVATMAVLKKLRRCYTLNIDCLETRFDVLRTQTPLVFIPRDLPLTIQLHGSLEYARCTACGRFKELIPEFYTGLNWDKIACPSCCIRLGGSDIREAKANTGGALRPNVILYDENPPVDDICAESRVKVLQKDIAAPVHTFVVAGTSATLISTQNVLKDLAGGKSYASTPQRRVVWIGLSPPPQALTPLFSHVLIEDCQLVAIAYFEAIGEARIDKMQWDLQGMAR